MKLTDITRANLETAIRDAKDEALRHYGGDFAAADGQVLVLDNDHERIGDPIDYFSQCPSVKMLRSVLTDYPEAHFVVVEGQTRYLADYGNAATQREESVPCGYWEVYIELN